MLASLDALRGLDLVWLHLTSIRPCLDVTIWEASTDAALLRTYHSLSTPRDVMLTMFVRTTRWLSMHLYTLAHMSMHESCLLVCCPCFNTMKLWTFDLNLHLSLTDTTFCLLSYLFAFSLVCFLTCLPSYACTTHCLRTFVPHGHHLLLSMSMMLICLMPLSYALCIFSFHCLSAGFLSLPLHVHTWSEDAWSYGTIAQAQAKRVRMRACGYKPNGYVQ